MNTYIWNTEYEVLICSAISEFVARQKLREIAILNVVNFINEGSTDSEKETRALCQISTIIDHLTILNKKPDKVLIEGTALIYTHANE